MTLAEVVETLKPLADSTLIAALVTAAASSLVGSVAALTVYRFKSREPIAGGITWQWVRHQSSQETEEPFLTIHNRSEFSAYLKRARWLRGNFIKWEAARYAFSYDSHDAGNFPLEIKANSATSFPLSSWRADQICSQASFVAKAITLLFKRNYLWIEVTTLGGAKLVVPANDATDFQQRPRWIDLRWFPYQAQYWNVPFAFGKGSRKDK